MNQFDQPIGNKENFISLHVPKPLELMTQLAAKRQHNYDTVSQDMANQSFAIKADPHNIKFASNKSKEYSKQLEQLASEWVNNPNDPSIQYKWSQLKNKYINDEERARLEYQYKMYNENYIKDRSNLEKENAYLGELDEYNYLQGSEDKITPWDYKGLQGLLKHDEEAKRTIGDIRADGSEIDSFDINPEDGSILKVKKGFEGVAHNKLINLVNQKVGNFLGSNEGKQYVKLLHMRNPELTDEELIQNVKSFMYNANAQKVGLNTKEGYDINWMPKDLRDKNQVQDDLGLGQTRPGDIDVLNELPKDIKNLFKVNQDGTLSTDYNALGRNDQSLFKYVPGTQPLQTGQSKERHLKLAKAVQKMADEIGWSGSINVDNRDLIVNKWMQKQKVLKGEYEYTPTEQDINTNRVLNYRNSYEFYNDKNEKMDNPLNNENIIKTFKADGRKTTKIGNETVSMETGTYINEDGKVVRIKMRNTTIERNNVFDAVAKQDEDYINYLKYNKKQPYSKEKEYGIDKVDNLKLISEVVVGRGANQMKFITVNIGGDKTNNKIQRVVLNPNYNKNGDTRKYLFFDIGTKDQFNKYLTDYYYTQTLEGKGELNQYLSNKQKTELNNAE